MSCNEISGKIIGTAVRVHRDLGPGLLEQAYKRCLVYELRKQKLDVLSEVDLPVLYHGVEMGLGYRLDILVEESVVVETKSVSALSALHKAQLITYLRIGDFPIGLLLNFNVLRLTDGIVRLVNSPDFSLGTKV